MVARQRELGKDGGVVMEGRDIGTAMFPNADVKVFLDADASIRAERRLRQNGSSSNEGRQQVLAGLAARDERDRTRSPRRLSPRHAIDPDTTHKSIDEVVAEVEEIVKAVDSG